MIITDLHPDPSPSFSKFTVGQSVDWEVTVKNIGNGPADSSTVEYYLGTSSNDFSNPISDDDTSALDSGESETDHDSYTFSISDIGQRYLISKANVDDDFDESNDGNNTKFYGPFDVVLPKPKVNTPSISPNGGTFSETTQVELSSSTSGAIIRYTTDGTTPTSSSTQYTGPFIISSSCNIKAVGFKSDYTDSEVVVSASFIITSATTATLTVSKIKIVGVTKHYFEIEYEDNNGININSIGQGDLRVVGPNFDQLVKNSGSHIYNSEMTYFSTFYYLQSPEGEWTSANNGTYHVWIEPNQVQDINGNYMPEQELGTFIVEIEVISELGKLSVVPSPQTVNPTAGTTFFTVDNPHNGDMTWTASVISGEEWLSIISGSNGLNSGIINVTFSANDTGSNRIGTIRVTASPGAVASPQDVKVVQSGSTLSYSIASWGRDIDNVPSGNDFKAIDCGENHCLALKSDGSIISFITYSYDDHGQISDTPSDNNFIAISGGDDYSLAIKNDGSIVSWGDDYFDQVSNTPSGNDFIAIAGGSHQSLALRSDGSIVSWGLDSSGQVSNTPSGNDFIAIASGNHHSLALKSDGSIVSWGYDNHGQVSDTPSSNDFIAIDSGDYHCLALKSDGSIVSWGDDSRGQVSNSPSGNDFIAITAGIDHSLALKNDGSIVSWGLDNYGQVSETPSGNGFIAITGGAPVSLALTNKLTLVPSIINLSQTNSELAITSVDLIVGTITVNYSDTVPVGNVISQNPTSDSSVDKGSAVDIVISLGILPVPELSVTPNSQTVNANSGPTIFTVNNIGSGTLSWTASVISGGGWLSITSVSSGTGSGTINVSFLANDTNFSRTGTIRITASGASGSPKEVTVIQSGFDTDNDSLPDSWEINYFGNLTSADNTTDIDGDGLLDKDEYVYETNPTEIDTDGDGDSDYDEIQYGSNPTLITDTIDSHRPVKPVIMDITNEIIPLEDANFSVDGFTDPDKSSGDYLSISEWQISLNNTFTTDQIVYQKEFIGEQGGPSDESTLCNLYLPSGMLLKNQTYWIRSRHLDSLGLESEWSESESFTTVLTDPNDEDEDGIDDSCQVDRYADTNENGMDDKSENIQPVYDAEDGLMVGVQTSNGSLSNLATYSNNEIPIDILPADPMPYGLFSFRVDGLPVDLNNPASVGITFYFSDTLPDNMKWWKYDSTKEQMIDLTANIVINGNIVVLIVTDGGTGDADGVVNGVIVDPSGPAFIAEGTVSTPSFSPSSGTYTSSQSVSISCSTSDVTIYYTIDGDEPTDNSSVYSSPITVSSTTTIMAKAFKTGWDTSETATGTYEITGTVSTPTLSPSSGTYTSSRSVTISCSTSNATIRYTTNGDDPTESSRAYSSSITVSNTTTIKAKAFKTGWVTSGTVTRTYTIDDSGDDSGGDSGGDDSGGGGGGGIFGAISINDVIGYHLDGIRNEGTRIYMPVTQGFKALKGAQTQIESFAPRLANIIRNGFESLERIAEADKDGLLYKIGTYIFPVLGKIAEAYLNVVGSPELMTNAYSNTMIDVTEFNNLNKQGVAIAPHIVTGTDESQKKNLLLEEMLMD